MIFIAKWLIERAENLTGSRASFGRSYHSDAETCREQAAKLPRKVANNDTVDSELHANDYTGASSCSPIVQVEAMITQYWWHPTKVLVDEILADCSQNRQSAKINSTPKFPAIRYLQPSVPAPPLTARRSGFICTPLLCRVWLSWSTGCNNQITEHMLIVYITYNYYIIRKCAFCNLMGTNSGSWNWDTSTCKSLHKVSHQRKVVRLTCASSCSHFSSNSLMLASRVATSSCACGILTALQCIQSFQGF